MGAFVTGRYVSTDYVEDTAKKLASAVMENKDIDVTYDASTRQCISRSSRPRP